MYLFKLMVIIVPFVIIYMTIDWEIAYYKKCAPFIKYRTTKGKMPIYLKMVGTAVLALLVCVPFIVLGMNL